MDIKEETTSNISTVMQNWRKLIDSGGSKEVQPSLEITTYKVPWSEDKSPEAAYLDSNFAFSMGSKLPRGKCRRLYGKKTITKQVMKLSNIYPIEVVSNKTG